MPSPSSFDEFFKSITSAPEYQALKNSGTNISDLLSLEKSLRDMQSDVAKANDLMKDIDTKFSVPEGKKNIGLENIGIQNPPKTGNPSDNDTKPLLEVQHFIRKEWSPWWFEAVAGMDDLKIELSESFIKPLRFKFLIEKLKKEDSKTPKTEEENKKHELLLRLYSEYEKFKISIPTGMLFYGPPGTGKTFITKKLAEELGCGFISKNMGEFGSSYLHQTTKNIKDFFEWAKKAAETEPVLLFLDEIDSLVSARTNNVDANKAEEVSQFLQEFNELEKAPNLIVIAATNRPDHLDPAILRSGRLDKKIYLGPPDEAARKALFRMYIEKAGRPSEKLDYDELAILTDGYVSADIEAICDEVARDASRDLLELIDEAETGKLTEADLTGHIITMDSIKSTIWETPSSLKMVDMSVYTSWLEKIG